MFQISNQNIRFRKNNHTNPINTTLNNKHNLIHLRSSSNRHQQVDPLAAINQNAYIYKYHNLSTPKNIRMLPKLDRNFLNQSQTASSKRYAQQQQSSLLYKNINLSASNVLKMNKKTIATSDIDFQNNSEHGVIFPFTSFAQHTTSKINRTMFTTSLINNTISASKSTSQQHKQQQHNQQQHNQQATTTTTTTNDLILTQRYFVFNRKGKRPYNQDRYCCKENINLYINNKFIHNNNVVGLGVAKHKQSSKSNITTIENNDNDNDNCYYQNVNNNINNNINILNNISKTNNNINSININNNNINNNSLIQCYSVFDGHGGSACSEYLKENFLKFLLRAKSLDMGLEAALKEAYATAQEKFLELCQKKHTVQRSGSCALTCIISQNKVYAANVGDCRALMFNKQYLCEMTKDHKPTQMSEKMRIIKSGGKIYKEQSKPMQFFNTNVKTFNSTRIAPGNLNVSRTIGDIEVKLKKYGGLPGMISPEPQIKVFEKQNYEILLLASDGLFQAFTNKQIKQFYYKMKQSSEKKWTSSMVQQFTQTLINEAEKRSTDNITVIVIDLRVVAGFGSKVSKTLQQKLKQRFFLSSD